MPRPKKCKRVCFMPETPEFVPVGASRSKAPVYMTVDEYETIRLIDREGFSQEECGERMGVARTTAQQIYASARKKLAEMLVEGLPLKIQGGEYKVCDGTVWHRGCGQCRRRRKETGEKSEEAKGAGQ